MKKGQKLPYAEKHFSLWLVGAAAMHVFVLFLALYFQLWDAGRHQKPKIVTVTLVSSAGSGASSENSLQEGAAGAVVAPSRAVPPPPVSKKSVKEPVPLPVPKKLPVIARKIAVEPPKPKDVEKKPDINQALLRLKQNVDKKTAQLPKPSATNLSSALDQLQQKVKSEVAGTGTGTGSGRGQASSSSGRNGVGKGYGGRGTADSYKAQIASIIQQNWAFSKQLLKNSYGMEVYVRINIAADGTIRQILYDKRAPSEYLNNSVKKALERSSPLPVLSKEEAGGDVWIGFVFTPEGIE